MEKAQFFLLSDAYSLGDCTHLCVWLSFSLSDGFGSDRRREIAEGEREGERKRANEREAKRQEGERGGLYIETNKEKG